MTNEEKIKSMSTEKLARGIKCLISDCIDCPAFVTCVNIMEDKKCLERMEEWLKAEAEDENL